MNGTLKQNDSFNFLSASRVPPSDEEIFRLTFPLLRRFHREIFFCLLHLSRNCFISLNFIVFNLRSTIPVEFRFAANNANRVKRWKIKFYKRWRVFDLSFAIQFDDYHHYEAGLNAARGGNLIRVQALHFRRRIIKPNQSIIKSNSKCLLQHFTLSIQIQILSPLDAFAFRGKWWVHNDAIFIECWIWCNLIISPPGLAI